MKKKPLLFALGRDDRISFGLVGLLDDASVHDSVAQLILLNGGVVTHAARTADSIHTAIIFLDLHRKPTDSVKTLQESSHNVLLPDSFHYSFVQDCVRLRRLLDPRPYRVQAVSVYHEEACLSDAIKRGCKWSQLVCDRSSVRVCLAAVNGDDVAVNTVCEGRVDDAPECDRTVDGDRTRYRDFLSALSLQHRDTAVVNGRSSTCRPRRVCSAAGGRSKGRDFSRSTAATGSGASNSVEELVTLSHSRTRGQRSTGVEKKRSCRRRSGLPRHKFSDSDDTALIAFVAKHAPQSCYSVTGRLFWSHAFYDMPRSLQTHSPLSLWTRFLRFVLPNLASYRVTVDAALLRCVAKQAGMAVPFGRAGGGFQGSVNGEGRKDVKSLHTEPEESDSGTIEAYSSPDQLPLSDSSNSSLNTRTRSKRLCREVSSLSSTTIDSSTAEKPRTRQQNREKKIR